MKYSPFATKAYFSLAAATLVNAQATATDLIIKIDGNDVTLPTSTQVSYDSVQDQNMRRPLSFSADGRSVILQGNLQRALPFPAPYRPMSVTASTVLKFDFTLEDLEEVHGICIEEDLVQTGQRCFIAAGSQDMGSTYNKWVRLEPQATMLSVGGTTVTYEIPLGMTMWGDNIFNYLVLYQDNDGIETGSRDTGKMTIANIEITNGAEPYITVDGATNMLSTAAQASFGGSQDNTKYGVTVLPDGSGITVHGNTHRSFPFATPVTIDKNTNLEVTLEIPDADSVVEVHAICFTDGDNWDTWTPYCIVAGGTQRWGDNFFDLPNPNVWSGETRTYNIPIGYYYQGTFSALTLSQDNDSSDRSTGESTWSNIRLTQVERPKLSIVSNGNTIELDSSTQQSVGSYQDTFSNFLEVDGSSITVKGNTWKAITIDPPIPINEATQIDFDFTLTELADHHTICVVTNTDVSVFTNRYHCFTPAWEQNNNWDVKAETNLVESNPALPLSAHFNFPVGLYVPPGDAHYLVFVQDADEDMGHTKLDGEATFSNIEFSQLPDFTIHIQGTDTPIFNKQISYSVNQDTTAQRLEISESGHMVSMKGNTWKAFEFPTPVTVTDDTVLRFKLNVEEETEIHGLCLDEDLDQETSERCFKLSGTQTNGLGTIMSTGIKNTYEGEPAEYMIRMKEYNTGVKNYIAFINDNDGADRTTGIAHFSDVKIYEIQPSCLKGATFDFELSECTVASFITMIETAMAKEPGCAASLTAGTDGWEEILAMFDLHSDVEVRDKIEHICSSAYVSNHMIKFDDLMEQGTAFLNEFWDGGTTWNYEIDDASGSPNLRGDAAKIKVVNDRFDGAKGIAFPEAHNFQGCDLRAAMCCYVANRGAEGYEPNDNSDACYMEFKNARQSSHVRDGYSIYKDGNEGAFNCHGFAWGNDSGFSDAALKGNTLFHVAMMHGLYTGKDVEELPGAPMCGCVEHMPVVTRADCTKTTVTQTVKVEYSPDTKFVAVAAITGISHSDCGDLSTHYATLVSSGKATEREQSLMEQHLVGEGQCGAALDVFLESKGFRFKTLNTIG